VAQRPPTSCFRRSQPTPPRPTAAAWSSAFRPAVRHHSRPANSILGDNVASGGTEADLDNTSGGSFNRRYTLIEDPGVSA